MPQGQLASTRQSASARQLAPTRRVAPRISARPGQSNPANGISQNTKIAVVVGIVGFLVLAIIGMVVRNTPLLVIGAFGFVAALAAMAYINKKQLTDSGRIIKRQGQWWKDEETFFTSATCGDVLAAMKGIDLSGTRVSVSFRDGGRSFSFKSSEWSGALTYEGESSGRNAFTLAFLNWKTSNGVNTSSDEMNIVLTAIEKLFLAIDPSASVQTRRGQYKSKVSFL